jgi:hypothetical protein
VRDRRILRPENVIAVSTVIVEQIHDIRYADFSPGDGRLCIQSNESCLT